MKQRMNGLKNRIRLPYAIILGIVLCLEIVVFNFSTWKTLGCEPVVLAEDVVTDETGKFSTETIEVHGNVKNIYVELSSVEQYDRAQVVVSVTDAGDYYAYDMPAYTVIPQVKGSGYRNIYSFGEVNTIKVTVTVPEGTRAEIESVAINVVRPFDIKGMRVISLFCILAVGYGLFTNCSIAKVVCERGNKKQVVAITCVVVVLALLASWLVCSNPVCVDEPWIHHKQYQQLARALEQGTVVLDENPDPGLIGHANPYDTIALQVEGISYRADYVFYDGKYYSYFGIIPEVLLFYPYYRLLDKDMSNYMAVFVLYSGMLVGIFGTLWELVHHREKKVSFVLYLLLGISVSLLSNYVFMLGRPDIYNIPVMAGNAFIWLGLFGWLRATNAKRFRWIWTGIGSLCMACVMGCRPQMVLYGIVFFGLFLLPVVWKNKAKWKQYGKDIAAFLVPFVVVGALVFWYNYARFGSGFEFGATYSLTTNDMNHRGFNFARILRGLYNFLFQPPVINAAFPFLDTAELASDYMGRNIVEFTYGGIFAIYPIVWSLLYVVLGGFRTLKKEEKCLVAGFGITACVIAGFDINAAGILQRYMGDMVIGFVLAAVFVIFILLDRYADSKSYTWLVKGTYCGIVFGLAFSFLLWICSGNSICLEKYNPQLFFQVAEYFKY